jgi:hypothetical protein
MPGRTLASADTLWSAAPWTATTPSGVSVLGANPELVDPATVFEPFTQYIAGQLPSAPLWNPYIMAGRPLEADAQSALFSPYSVPSYVLPFWRSLEWAALAKLFVSALGVFVLARIALGMSFAGALLAGAVFAFGLNTVAWLPWPLTSVWSFAPWLLLAVDRVARRPSALGAAGLSAAVALQYLGGHPESSFQVMAVAAVFALYRLFARWRAEGRGSAAAALAALAGSMLLGTALAAVAIIPFVELLAHSSAISQRAGQTAVTPKKFLLGILLPDYWGRPTQTTLAGFEVQRAFYAGAFTLVLGAVALAVRRSADRVFFALLGLVCLAVVVGLPPFSSVFNRLPGFDVTYNTRLTVFYLLAIAVLAGFGLDDLMAGISRGRISLRRALVTFAVALTLFPVVVLAARGEISAHLFGRAMDVAWGFARPPNGASPEVPIVIRMASLIVWLSFAGLGLVLLTARLRGRMGSSGFAVLVVVLIVADLFRAGMGENPAIPISHARQPATPAIRYLQAERPARFVGVPPTRPFESIPITPDTAMTYGLYDARGYDLPVESRYDALWRHSVSDAQLIIPPTQLAPINARSLPALDLLGVSDIVQTPSDPPLTQPGLQLVYSGADARIYANPAAMPRATLVGSQRVVRSASAQLADVTSADFDRTGVAIVSSPLAGLPAAAQPGRHQQGADERSPGRAHISRYGAERVVIDATASRRSLLILNDVYYPGWTATVDGRAAPIARVDYLLRGVALTPGTHRVVMVYRPASWRDGLVISLVALTLVLALVGYGVAVQNSTADAR